MKRLQQETTFDRVARNNQSRDCRKRLLGLLFVPLAAPAGGERRKGEQASADAVAVTALDVPVARILKHSLDARAEELEVDRSRARRSVSVRRQTPNPLQHHLVLG